MLLYPLNTEEKILLKLKYRKMNKNIENNVIIFFFNFYLL